jgi:peptidyl-prolyl cis-trans isomerase A (cyclophilin A)
MKLGKSLLIIMLCVPVASFAQAGPGSPQGKSVNPMVLVKTNMGSFTVELFPKEAPITVANFLRYVDTKFYDGTTFHRVMPGFVIQGGGFDKNMVKKDTLAPIKNEATNGLKNLKGTLSMARTNDISSATSQFFVNLKDNAPLDHVSEAQYGYAVFAKVVKGFEVVEKIATVKTTSKDPYQNVPEKPVIIESITKIAPPPPPPPPAPKK